MVRFCCALLSVIVSLPAVGQEWTRFRGPNGSGVAEAPNVPAAFAEKDYNWKITLPGGGHSSPVVWGDRVFVTCSDKTSATRIVMCMGAADGKVIWKREFKSHTYRQHADNDYASSSPTVDEKHLYVCWTTPEEYSLTCLDHEGKDVWTCDLGRYTSQHGSGTSPIVVGDLVLLGNDQEGPHSSIFGIDRNTGKKVWEAERAAGQQGGMSAATPVVFDEADGVETAVFCSRFSGIAGIDPKTGEVVWQVKDAFKNRTVGSPVIAGDKVIGFSGEGTKGHEFVVVEPHGQKAKVAYQLKEATPYVPTPVVKGDLLFTLSDVGMMTCYHAASGEKVWQQKIGAGFYSSPVCVSGRIYCISKKGEVTCLAAADHYQLLGKSELGELTHATPAVSGGRMYLRTYTHLISVGK